MSKTSAEFHKLSHAHHEQRISAHKEAMDGEHKDSARHAFHKASIAHHEPLRDFHKAAMEKAVSDDLGKADLTPTNISAVTPEKPGIRAIPRYGQQLPERPNVPEQFQHLATVDD